jgi:hypothetical protein
VFFTLYREQRTSYGPAYYVYDLSVAFFETMRPDVMREGHSWNVSVLQSCYIIAEWVGSLDIRMNFFHTLLQLITSLINAL